ncbi:MAG: hypothetical protein KDD38_05625 [Bdellovibrionales bacterium]|nr:hypothetical protein [Bdellovibrionales bacterium]
MRLFLALIISLSIASPLAYAGRAQVVGSYAPLSLKNIGVSCSSSDIKTVTLLAGKPKACRGNVRIRNISVKYASGLSQIFEFPNETGRNSGSVLMSTTFRVLPGTKCLNSITADLTVNGERNLKCLDQHRVQVVIERTHNDHTI